jgi:hypothetical protein
LPPDPDVVQRAFSPHELQVLQAAEDLAPWGEAAQTMRTEMLCETLIAIADGAFTLEARQSAHSRAAMIRKRLHGIFDDGRRKRPNVSAITGT